MSLVIRPAQTQEEKNIERAGKVWMVEKAGKVVGFITKIRNTASTIFPYQLFETADPSTGARSNLLGSFYTERDVANIIDSQPTPEDRDKVLDTIRGGGFSAAKVYATRIWLVNV